MQVQPASNDCIERHRKYQHVAEYLHLGAKALVLDAPVYAGTKQQTITPDTLQQSGELAGKLAVAGETSAQQYHAGLDTADIGNPEL